MTWIEALILGIIQGLTEFIPVSSSGHLELGKALLGVQFEEELSFSVFVHFATVLSTIIVFRKEILELILGVLRFKYDDNLKFVLKIGLSMIPVMVVGLFLKDFVEGFFSGRIVFVGLMLFVTAALLTFTYFVKQNNKNISYLFAFIIGLAQAIAVLPGISRAGATIATGLMLGVKRDEVAKFSFLMVLIPIIGASLLDFKDANMFSGSMPVTPIIVGFMAAFLSGLFACTWMLKMIKKGKLIYFAIYCVVVGLIAITSALL